jgi:hypothetical protein
LTQAATVIQYGYPFHVRAVTYTGTSELDQLYDLLLKRTSGGRGQREKERGKSTERRNKMQLGEEATGSLEFLTAGGVPSPCLSQV